MKGTVKAQGSICVWCDTAGSIGWWALSRGRSRVRVISQTVVSLCCQMLEAIDVVCPTATHEANENGHQWHDPISHPANALKKRYISWPLVSFTCTRFVHKTIKIWKLPIPKYLLRQFTPHRLTPTNNNCQVHNATTDTDKHWTCENKSQQE